MLLAEPLAISLNLVFIFCIPLSLKVVKFFSNDLESLPNFLNALVTASSPAFRNAINILEV